MKKKLIICALFLTLALSACSNGISQEKYDTLVTEKEELQKKYDEVSKKRDELAAKVIEHGNTNAEKESKAIAPSVWAKTSFGEDCIYLIDNPKYMQCIVPGNNTSSTESISAIWKNIKTASLLLNTKAVEDIDYEKIAVKYLAEDGTALIEFVLIKQSDGYELDNVSGDLTKATSLSDAITTVSK
jgi:outer membrane murein-binding lipoprotein Lpp